MRAVFIFGLLGCFGVAICIAQPAFNRTYRTLADTTQLNGNSGYAVIPLKEGYFISGDGYSMQFDGWASLELWQMDSVGNVVWQKEYGKDSNTYNPAMGGGTQKYYDGGYIIPGGIGIFKATSHIYTASLIRIDSVGDTLWTRTYGNTNYDQFNGCVITPGKNIVAAGTTTSMGEPNGDVLLVKVDSSGNLLWKKSYGGDQLDDAFGISLMADGGFIISGETESYGPGSISNYLIRTDSSGNVIWSRTYGVKGGSNYGCVAYPSNQGGFLMFGNWDSVLSYGIYYVAKLDTGGNVEWMTFFDDTNDIGINQIRELDNGEIIVASQKEKPSKQGYGAAITKLGVNGNRLWQKLLFYNGSDIDSTYAFNNSGNFYDFRPTKDNGFIFTGTVDYIHTFVPVVPPDNNLQDMWVVKTDSLGCVNSYCGIEGVQEIAQNKALSLAIYPNPAQSIANIQWQPVGEEVQILVFDLLGRIVRQAHYDPGITGKTQLDISGFANGLYIVKLILPDGGARSGKLAVAR